MGVKLFLSKSTLRSTSRMWYLRPLFAPPAWTLISFLSADNKSWDEMESVPFSSSYPTAVWLGHAAGLWQSRVWTPRGCGSSCADWQRLTTLAATFQESPPQVFTQCLCWSSASHSELAEPNRPMPQLLWGVSPASSHKCLTGTCPVFAQKQPRWAPTVRATSSTGRDRRLAEGWEQRARNLRNCTLHWIWECKSKSWYKLNWCSFCVQVSPLIFELPKASRDHYLGKG